jgi:5-methylcytosine-specific restriction enzyme subunit McrC
MTKDKSILIQNVYYMLTYAFRVLRQENYERIQTESFDNVRDLLAAILSRGISTQLKRGLSRVYMEKREDMSILRGKVDMSGSIRLKLRKQRQLSCTYDELSENHLMNQVLKTTALILIRCREVRKELRDELKKQMLFFSGVDTLEPGLIRWNTFRYHSNNATYKMLMNVCYLVLEGLLLTTDAGDRKLGQFLDDQYMSTLYEKFILCYYQQHYPQYKAAAKQITWDTEDKAIFLPSMQSDTMLQDGDRRLVIDAKYYTRIMSQYHDKAIMRSGHLYQIYTYVHNEDKAGTGLVDGMLLYAKTDESMMPGFDYMVGGNRMSVKVLDLNTSFSGIRKQLDEIVRNWDNLSERRLIG